MVGEENLKVLDAIFKVKEEFKKIEKDGDNPFFKSKYVTLNQVLDMVVPLLRLEGVELLQPTDVIESSSGEVVNVLKTILVHEEGESLVSTMVIPNLGDIQKLGGAITYLRRYMLKSLLALQDEDDDGETASGRGSGFGGKKTASKTASKGRGKKKEEPEEKKEESGDSFTSKGRGRGRSAKKEDSKEAEETTTEEAPKEEKKSRGRRGAKKEEEPAKEEKKEESGSRRRRGRK